MAIFVLMTMMTRPITLFLAHARGVIIIVSAWYCAVARWLLQEHKIFKLHVHTHVIITSGWIILVNVFVESDSLDCVFCGIT